MKYWADDLRTPFDAVFHPSQEVRQASAEVCAAAVAAVRANAWLWLVRSRNRLRRLFRQNDVGRP